MNREERSFVRKNLIKLIIGLILLWFSWSYIQNHPAEKSSIFSGFQVLWQRVVVYVHKVTNTNSEAYAKKYEYEKTYDELKNMAQTKKCTDPNILTAIDETYISLKNEWIKTLEENLPGYIRKANEYKNLIDNCTK
jgi:predicted negative regulator of RcsB-dependent stress response